MKELQLPRFGPPEVFRLVERDDPTPGPGEVRVSTAAAGVNFADLMQRLGLYGNAPKTPYVPGFEIAGTIAAVGTGCDLAVGDRVVLMTQTGGYASEVLTPAEQVLRLPESISFEQAAAIPVNYLTAWMCLFTMGNLRADETVLIHGGAGGVGTAAMQLAVRHGARVVATAGSGVKLAWLRDAGADLAVNYRDPAWADAIADRYGKRAIDLVLDPVGGVTMQRSYALLAPLGRLVGFGLYEAVGGPGRNLWRAWRAWRNTPRFQPLEMTQRNTGVFGFHLGLLRGKEARVMEAFAGILELTESGAIAPVIDSTFPLSEEGVAAAHHRLHARENLGKVLLVT